MKMIINANGDEVLIPGFIEWLRKREKQYDTAKGDEIVSAYIEKFDQREVIERDRLPSCEYDAPLLIRNPYPSINLPQ